MRVNFGLMKVFDGKRKTIERLCAENKVVSLFAFGSSVRDELKKTATSTYWLTLKERILLNTQTITSTCWNSCRNY